MIMFFKIFRILKKILIIYKQKIKINLLKTNKLIKKIKIMIFLNMKYPRNIQ